MENNQNSVNDFWDNFRKTVIEHNIPEKYAEWYVKWGEKFALSIKGKPLRLRDINDVRSYISKIRADGNLQEWQIKQAQDALHILYNEYLKIPLSSSRSENPAAPVKPDKTLPKKDKIPEYTVSKKEVEEAHKTLLESVRKEIQYRHYSIRTEYSYIEWIIKFIMFCNNDAPENLNSEEIRRYLSHLASDRNVSASTQNQALNAIVFMYTQVMKKDPGDFSDFYRAKRDRKVPVVLTVREMNLLLNKIEGVNLLMAGLLYGAGRKAQSLKLKAQSSKLKG